MKVAFKDTNVVNFSTIRCGGTFIDQDYDEDTILMRVKAYVDVVLGTDTAISEDFDGYAVDIQMGKIMGYYNYDEVIPVEAEVVVQK